MTSSGRGHILNCGCAHDAGQAVVESRSGQTSDPPPPGASMSEALRSWTPGPSPRDNANSSIPPTRTRPCAQRARGGGIPISKVDHFPHRTHRKKCSSAKIGIRVWRVNRRIRTSASTQIVSDRKMWYAGAHRIGLLFCHRPQRAVPIHPEETS